MYRFSGEYECKIDDKGRLTLPARLKSALPETEETGLILFRGFEPCLSLYTAAQWEGILNKVLVLDEFNDEQRAFQRTFLSRYTEVEMDKAGRFLLPRTMMRYARLEKDLILFGLGNRMELWNPELYEEYFNMESAEFSEKAERFLGKRSLQEDKPVIVNINRQTPSSDVSPNAGQHTGG